MSDFKSNNYVFIIRKYMKSINTNDGSKINIVPSNKTIKKIEAWAKVFKGF